MKQGSLFSALEQEADISCLMQTLRSAMRKSAENNGLSREQITDKLNAIAKENEVKLTLGSTKAVSKETLDKWLSPSDSSHPPSILALIAFCVAVEDMTVLLPLVKSMGSKLSQEFLKLLAKSQQAEIMTEEDKRLRDYAKALVEERKIKKRKKRLEEDLYE